MRHHGAAKLLRLPLRDLAPTNAISQKEHGLVLVLKGYFDGGNQADSEQYDRITLATVCGTLFQWSSLESDWNDALSRHSASFIHTTNAVGLQKEFSQNKGWNNDKVDNLLSDCVRVIERHLYVPDGKSRFCSPLWQRRETGVDGSYVDSLVGRLQKGEENQAYSANQCY